MNLHRWIVIMVLLVVPVVGAAEEHIGYFATEIVVTPDEQLIVTDMIRATSTGERIKYGILRELPRTIRFEDGADQVPTYAVTRIQVDGNDTKPVTRMLNETQRVYLGQKDKPLEMGDHEFLMQLKAFNTIRVQENMATLVWDVTGSYVALPIAKVIAVIKLPRTINPQSVRSAAYTGSAAQRSKDYSVGIDEEGNIRFETTRTLIARETLHITLHWERSR